MAAVVVEVVVVVVLMMVMVLGSVVIWGFYRVCPEHF